MPESPTQAGPRRALASLRRHRSAGGGGAGPPAARLRWPRDRRCSRLAQTAQIRPLQRDLRADALDSARPALRLPSVRSAGGSLGGFHPGGRAAPDRPAGRPWGAQPLQRRHAVRPGRRRADGTRRHGHCRDGGRIPWVGPTAAPECRSPIGAGGTETSGSRTSSGCTPSSCFRYSPGRRPAAG